MEVMALLARLLVLNACLLFDANDTQIVGAPGLAEWNAGDDQKQIAGPRNLLRACDRRRDAHHLLIGPDILRVYAVCAPDQGHLACDLQIGCDGEYG